MATLAAEPHAEKQRAAWMLPVAVLGLAAGLQTVDPMIASVALVKASRALGFSASTQAFAASVSTLALAASVIATGLMADRLGRRRVFVAALATAAVGDLLVALIPAPGAFMLGRAVAGVGLGAVMSCAFAYVLVVAGRDVGEALGLWAALTMLTTLVGSLLGGILADANWRLAFLFVPVCAVLLMLPLQRLLPLMPKIPGTHIDYVGLLLSGVGMVLLLLGISKLSTAAGSATTWALIVVGLAGFAGFAWWEKVTAHPVFPIQLFLRPVFVVAAVSGIGWNLAQAVAALQLSNLWQYVTGFTTSEVSFGQLPVLAGAVVAALLTGRALARGVAVRSLMMWAFVAVAVGFVVLALVRRDTPYWFFVIPMVFIGAGTTAVSVPQSQMFLKEAPKEFYGPVTSTRSTVGQLGFALGMAGASALMSALTLGGITERLTAAGSSPTDIASGLDAVNVYVQNDEPATTEVGRQALSAAAESYLSAFSITMLTTAAIMLAMGVMAWRLLRPRPDAATAGDPVVAGGGGAAVEGSA